MNSEIVDGRKGRSWKKEHYLLYKRENKDSDFIIVGTFKNYQEIALFMDVKLQTVKNMAFKDMPKYSNYRIDKIYERKDRIDKQPKKLNNMTKKELIDIIEKNNYIIQ
jgi:hypothetical protein